MSGLRQVSKKDTSTNKAHDVEAPNNHRWGDIKCATKPPGIAASPISSRRSRSRNSRGGIPNPIFLGRIICSKVLVLLSSSSTYDDDDVTQHNHDNGCYYDITKPRGLIFLFRDILLGIILAVMAMTLLIAFDHINILHFERAHAFRNAAFDLLTDPDTLASIEEASELKILPLTEYQSTLDEIDTIAEKLRMNQQAWEKKHAIVVKRHKEMDLLRRQYDILVSLPMFGVDKFCGECVWKGGTTCGGRVDFLMAKYKMKPVLAKMNVLESESCRKE
mmetsp:Transcript_12167/g.25903  ORF Transcript_12167/g.25903 Transcript_12167/m.25903 type:complete len:276 (-) Transcript_12167:62-889(-)